MVVHTNIVQNRTGQDSVPMPLFTMDKTNTKYICPNPLVDKIEYSWFYLPMDKTK